MQENSYSDLNKKVLDEFSRKLKAKQIVSILKKNKAFSPKDKLKVLDIGCSSGVISEYLAKEIGSVTGIDIDRNALLMARRNQNKYMKFKYMDANKLKFQDASFDIVIANQVYIYILDLTNFINEIYRVLKPGGLLLLSGANKYSFKKPTEPVECYYKSFWELSRLFKRFDIKYQSKEIFSLRFSERLASLIPKSVWKLLEPLTPNFVWILKK